VVVVAAAYLLEYTPLALLPCFPIVWDLNSLIFAGFMVYYGIVTGGWNTADYRSSGF
jgi:hypothetical protein